MRDHLHQPFPLLDEAPEQLTAPTLEQIQCCTTPDELRTAHLNIQCCSLTAVERAALEAALRTRAETLNISSWDFTAHDGGKMSAVAACMVDSMVSGAAVVAILDDVAGRPLRIRIKGSQANFVSDNRRVYLSEVLTDAVEVFNSQIKRGYVVEGEELHPPMDMTDAQGRPRYRRTPSKSLLRPEKAFMQGDELLAECTVIETTAAGRKLAADIRAGNPVFFSQRAYGYDMRVAPLADGRQVSLPMRMEIETWDRVNNPAIPDARPIAVLDSVQVQALLDAVNLTPAPISTRTQQEGSFMWTIAMVQALAKTADGRRQLAQALTDATLTAEIRTAMTDSLATPLEAATQNPAAVSPDAIAQAVTDEINRRAEATRLADQAAATARQEAATYVTEQIGALRTGGRYPAPLLDSIAQRLANVADRATAETLLQAQIGLTDSMMAQGHLAGLGFGAQAGAALTAGVQVSGNPTPWTPIVDNLMAAFDEFRALSGGGSIDPEVRKVNKRLTDKLLAHFDRQNGRGLVDSANGWGALTDAITTSDLYTQPIMQRVLLLQAFGDADMLQFLYSDTVEGDTFRVPVEYFEEPKAGELDVDEMGSIAEGIIRTNWLNYSPVERAIRFEITNRAQTGGMSGPLGYNAAARALYHISAHFRRVINRLGGNEMLRASDAYGALQVTETVAAGELVNAPADAGNTKYRVTLRRGGGTGALTTRQKNTPVVRPASYVSHSDQGAPTVVMQGQITVTIGGAPVTLGRLRTDADGINYIVDKLGANITGVAVDFENGYLYVSDGLTVTPGASECVVTYSYATNFDLFDLDYGSGDEAAHYSGLLRLAGRSAAHMGSYPRYLPPNFALGSFAAMEYVAQADLFYNLNSPKGTTLSAGTNNFIASRNSVDFAKHNTQWQAGDSRILLGRVGATKYGVRNPLTPKGPFPSYDTNMKVTNAEQWLAEEFSVLCTPEVTTQAGKVLNPYYRTIKLIPKVG